MADENSNWVSHQGGCHCGKVRWEVQAPADLVVDECNCSMCKRSGYWHLIVSRDRFKLLAGEHALTCYAFNTGVAQHLFCRHCGVKSHYVPRSNPDGWSVNARCIDSPTVNSISIRAFDGQNWEANADSLKHLSESS